MTYKDGKTCGTCADWEKLQIETWRGVCKSQNSLAHNDTKDACETCRWWRPKTEEFHLADIAE